MEPLSCPVLRKTWEEQLNWCNLNNIQGVSSNCNLQKISICIWRLLKFAFVLTQMFSHVTGVILHKNICTIIPTRIDTELNLQSNLCL